MDTNNKSFHYVPPVQPPTGVKGFKLDVTNPDVLSRMTNDQLQRLRSANPDPVLQQRIAPYEHRAFVREVYKEKPILGVGFGLVANPVYEALKASPDVIRNAFKGVPLLDTTKSRSGGTMANVKGGLMGLVDTANFARQDLADEEVYQYANGGYVPQEYALPAPYKQLTTQQELQAQGLSPQDIALINYHRDALFSKDKPIPQKQPRPLLHANGDVSTIVMGAVSPDGSNVYTVPMYDSATGKIEYDNDALMDKWQGGVRANKFPADVGNVYAEAMPFQNKVINDIKDHPANVRAHNLHGIIDDDLNKFRNAGMQFKQPFYTNN